MHAISGPSSAASAGALWTTAAVRPVRAATSGTQRSAAGTDRFVRSAPGAALPQVTYGRNGRGASAPAGTDGDRD